VNNFPYDFPTLTFNPGSALYVILFLHSIHTLRRRIPGGKILLVTAWTMFVLATCSTVNLSTATGTSMRVVYALVQSPRETPLRLVRLYRMLILVQDIILAMNK
jgi:hypothetical protein